MCILKVHSNSHSFKEYAAQNSVPVYSVRDSGDVRRKSTGEMWKDNAISFDVSDREWDDFPGQVQDAISCLGEHRSALAELLAKPFISDAYLDFPLWSRIDGNIVNQNERLPKELVALCGALGIGIDIAIYEREPFVDEGMAEQAAEPIPRAPRTGHSEG